MTRLALRDAGVQRAGTRLVDALNLELPAGQVVAIVGPNGAGKSTALNMASGAWPCTSGEVLLDNRPLAQWSLRERAQRMAVLPQQSSLSFPFRVSEVVALGRLPHASSNTHNVQCVHAALEMFDLLGLAQTPYTRLSGGERQRVQLARVLAQVWTQKGAPSAGVLLLDEPTAALDWAHQLQLLEHLRELAVNGMSVLLVLHDLNLAMRYADQVAVMRKGRLHACGAPESVLDAATIAQVFGVQVSLQAHPRGGRPLIVQ